MMPGHLCATLADPAGNKSGRVQWVRVPTAGGSRCAVGRTELVPVAYDDLRAKVLRGETVKKGRHRRYEEARALKRGSDLDIESILNDLSGDSDESIDDDDDDEYDYDED